MTTTTPPPPAEGLSPAEISTWGKIADRIRRGKVTPNAMRIPPGINQALKRAAASKRS
ncbi:hypothetical protein MKK55_18105 [Methylobacterium sp. J-059]|uniref:hypothetical protein n=1 Tax=Methylobacterium sp. J-059 TaxID=2836643 RepID=UPI001FBB91E7|nr:hypothetical protein [Methylobacterium sp. J-059]MCJ2040846.1 hypothetical protein [Methylobacterium sp. J-059]